MSDTTSNQKRVVATKGTPHIARTQGSTDEAIDPCTGAKASFPNQVKMPLLTPGTSKTFIADQPIWTKPHQVGPSSEPPHPPFVVGVVSGTHIMEAKATSYSSDVLAEGNGVVRSNDSTTQNHGNTSGIVDGSMIAGQPCADEDFLKKQCTIVELTGVNEVDGEAPDGFSLGKATAARPLGYPGAKQSGVPPFYIEILSGSKVKLTATRKDVTQPTPASPTCWKQGEHTKWLAKRTGEGACEAMPLEGKDEYTVEPPLTSLEWGNDERLVMPSRNTAYFNETSIVSPSTPEQVSKKNRGNLANENVQVTGRQKVQVSGALNSIEAVFAYFLYKNNPVNVNVQALSCGASRNVQVRVFPKQKVNVEVNFSESVEMNLQTERRGRGRRAMASAMAAVGKIREVGWMVQKVAELAQKNCTVEFCVETKIAFEMGYKPCTEEKRGFFGNLYTPAHVGLPWKLTFSAMKLIGFSIELEVSLLNFAAPFMPAIVGALRRIGVKADLVFSAGLNVPLNFSIGQDEYDYWTNTGIEVAICPTLALYLVIQTGVQWIKAGFEFPISLSAAFTGGDKPKVIMQLQPKGELKVVWTVIVLEDTWFESSWNGEIDALRVTWTGPKIDVITVS